MRYPVEEPPPKLTDEEAVHTPFVAVPEPKVRVIVPEVRPDSVTGMEAELFLTTVAVTLETPV